MKKQLLYLDIMNGGTIPCLIDIWNSFIAETDIPTAWID